MAFFSGTDSNTLNKIGESMNHCVSLIVNNAGQYVARITRIVDEKYDCVANGSYNSFNNEKREFNYNFTGGKKVLEYIDADIEISEPRELTDDEKEFLDKRIEEIDIAKREERDNRIETFNGWFDDEIDMYGWRFRDQYYPEYDEPKEKKDTKNYKSFVYSLITGDLFPLGCVVNKGIESVVSDALKIYDVKKRRINSIIDKEDCIDCYIDAIMNYYIRDLDENQCIDMTQYAASVLFDYTSRSKWINDLYQILIMYEY